MQFQKCLDDERTNVSELNAALAEERDRVARLNKDLRDVNENREKLLRNETSHTQVLKSRINSLNVCRSIYVFVKNSKLLSY